MSSIDDSSLKIHKVSQVAKELGISQKTIFELAKKTDSNALFYIPDNTEIYLTDNTTGKFSKSIAEEIRSSYSKNHGTLLQASSEIKLLGLRPFDLDLIIKTGELRKNTFQIIATLTKDTGITYLTPDSYSEYHLKKKIKLTYLSDLTFRTTHRNTENDNRSGAQHHTSRSKENIENNIKSITITPNDLYISHKDLNKIRDQLSNQEPNLGNFKKGEWTSKMLYELNEASTHFFSEESTDNNNQSEKKLEIEEWLRSRWGSATGTNLLDVATNSILPDSWAKELFIISVNISQRTETIRNSHTSTLLSIINELAMHYWEESKQANTRYRTGQEIIYDLKKQYNFTERVSKAISTIIRPDKVNKAMLSRHAQPRKKQPKPS